MLLDIKDRLIEFIKFDCNQYKYPLVLVTIALSHAYRMIGFHEKAFSIASNVFRTGWTGSDKFGLNFTRYYFLDNPELGKKLSKSYVDSIQPLSNTQKFFDDPLNMLDGVVTVLKENTSKEKGVLIIKYSYYFPLFIKMFDIQKISQSYHIILEPSWAGFCDLNILSYSQFDFPVFVQCYEKRDKEFLLNLNANFVPIDVGPSWFIDHTNFNTSAVSNVRDIDIIMVAAWAKYKRHKAFLEAIKPLITNRSNLSILLIGYPGDLKKSDIQSLVDNNGMTKNVKVLEWLKPQEVANYQKRAKVNILWSKFEGNNRAIIEGMFSNTPAIMREGHNYGEHYDFINSKTGHFASESNLSSTIEKVIESDANEYSPRAYVLENRNCIKATEIMGNTIKKWEKEVNNTNWTNNLAIKINNVHGMKYFQNYGNRFEASYSFIKSCIRK